MNYEKAYEKLQNRMESDLQTEVKVHLLQVYYDLMFPNTRQYIDTENDHDVDKSGIIHRIGAKQFKECCRWQVDIEGDGICDCNPDYDFNRVSDKIARKFIECYGKFANKQYSALATLYEDFLNSDHEGHELMLAVVYTDYSVSGSLIKSISSRNYDTTKIAESLLEQTINGVNPRNNAAAKVYSIEDWTDRINRDYGEFRVNPQTYIIPVYIRINQTI
jgi:hypothetical protein